MRDDQTYAHETGGSAAEGEASGSARAASAEGAAEAASPEQRAEEYLRLAQRAQADLINYRRRVDQERDESRAASRVETAGAILPVLDDFERALAAIPDEERAKPWVQGIVLIERNLRGVIERAGLERIDAQGQPFDPWAHEAIMTDDSGEHDDDTVTEVIRPGYRAGSRVVRPAQVKVARKSA